MDNFQQLDFAILALNSPRLKAASRQQLQPGSDLLAILAHIEEGHASRRTLKIGDPRRPRIETIASGEQAILLGSQSGVTSVAITGTEGLPHVCYKRSPVKGTRMLAHELSPCITLTPEYLEGRGWIWLRKDHLEVSDPMLQLKANELTLLLRRIQTQLGVEVQAVYQADGAVLA